MSRGAMQFWDRYTTAMAVSGVLTSVDGEALAALCEDQALLRELRIGWRGLVSEMRKKLKAEKRTMPGNPTTALSRTIEGRRTLASMIALGNQIQSREREFGLMPGSRSRVEVAPGVPGGKRMDAIEAALCGTEADLWINKQKAAGKTLQ